MSIGLITFLLLVMFLILLCLGLPLAWSLGSTATIFILFMFNPNVMTMAVGRAFKMSLDYTLVAIPLFVFMASVLQKSGLADKLFKAVYILSGPLRGGLAVGSVISSTIMAAVVGIVGAEIATFGLIALPAMLKRNYDKRIALGSVCAGGGIATLIPPSIVFIVYAMTASVSVGDLFIAGIIPGLLLASLFIAYILFMAWRYPEMAPSAPAGEINRPFKEKLRTLKGLISPAILAFVVLGSIYAGIATPSEAASIGCIGALVTTYFNRTLKIKLIEEAVYETLTITCMLLWLFFGAQALIGFYTLAGGDQWVQEVILGLSLGPWGTVICMQIVMLILGMFLDWIGIILLTMPLFVPIIIDLGFNPIWFGVVFCMNMQISYLSPPFGPSVFWLKTVVGDEISVTEIYKANMPFLVLTLIALALTVAFPSLSLWLPGIKP